MLRRSTFRLGHQALEKDKDGFMKKFLILVILMVLGIGAGLAHWAPVFAGDQSSVQFSRAIQLFKVDVDHLTLLQIKAKTPLFERFFGATGSQGILNYISSLVKNLSWLENPPEGVIAAASDGIMFLTEGYIDSSMPQIGRWGVLIHESRHLVGGGWPHTWCPSPYYFVLGLSSYRIPELDQLSVAACDESEMGAYGIQYTFLRAVAESCSNCTDKVIMDARFFSDIDGMIRISNAKAALRLLEGANLNPAQAKKEIDQLLRH